VVFGLWDVERAKFDEFEMSFEAQKSDELIKELNSHHNHNHRISYMLFFTISLTN
jgi:hypothetical protein